jgi:8-oxo-dGTP pyrophosphatase MutT (NUDIX family)
MSHRSAVSNRLDRQLDRLRLKLSRSEPMVSASAGKVAAVLVPIFERDGEGHMLFIRRSQRVSHQGQVAFPGGRVEPTDRDLRHTALREAFEEVGIEPDTVELLGLLPAKDTLVSGYRVAPFVGVIPEPRALRRDPHEVAEVFTVPITVLADPRHRGVYEYRREGRHPSKRPAILYAGQTIWGLTYRITLDLLELMAVDE